MAPRLPSRTYGSLEGPLSSESIRPAPYTDATSFESERSGVNFASSPHTITESRTHSKGKTRRWAAIAVVCGLAFVAVTALMRAGTRLPNSNADTVADAVQAEDFRNGNENLAAQAAQAPPRASEPVPRFDGSIPTTGGAPHLTAPLAFTAVNFYHIRDGKPAEAYPWLKGVKLIEPFRETTLAVSSPREGFTYRWSVKGGDNSDGAGEVELTEEGSEVTVMLTKLDENVITLEERNSNTGVTSRRTDETVMVKYVRREIRTLTDEERVELLTAMHTLWSVKVQNGNGKELYGDDYADIWAINRLHYKAASPLSCDHFHDGLGFLTNHALLSNTFEYSLQRVNPKLTLPYWDFTIESSTAGGAGEGVAEPQASSPLLQSSWFGTHDPQDSQVKDGRWAFTEIPLEHVNNPGGLDADVYSKLRAPWNVNDRAYLTRGLGAMCGVRVQEAYPWPTCKSHYKLATEYTDFYSWVWYSLYDPHGPVHVWLGGTLDCADTYRKIESLAGATVATNLSYVSFVHRKNLFRDGLFKCEGNVQVSEKPDEVMKAGVCGCLGYDLSQGDDYKTIMNTMAFLGDEIGDFEDDVQRQVVGHLCSGMMNDGDHLQASSSLDPTFWPTHPTMERLWMYSLLAGKMTDFTWPDADVTVTASDGTSYTEAISAYGDDCVGHRGSDVFPFGLLETDVADFKVRTGIKGNVAAGNVLTNREILHAFDPRGNNLPYVYDNFEWTHCTADGYDMTDAWHTPETPETNSRSKTGTVSTEGAKDTHGASGTPETVGARTMFKGGPRYPMYNTLKNMSNKKPQNVQG